MTSPQEFASVDAMMEWLGSLPLTSNDLDILPGFVSKNIEKHGEVIEVYGGTDIYFGHEATKHLPACPPFNYAWIRLTFSDDHHIMYKFKLKPETVDA